jgi:hypothetical protein
MFVVLPVTKRWPLACALILTLAVIRDTQIHDQGNNDDDEIDHNADVDVDAASLSPWSDESQDLSDDDAKVDAPGRQQVDSLTAASAIESIIKVDDSKVPADIFSESMRGVESVLSQLVRLGFRIRQFASIGKSQMVNSKLDDEEQAALRHELITMFRAFSNYTKTRVAVSPQGDHTDDCMSTVQTRLIDSVLRRRIDFECAWNHMKSQILRPVQADDASRSAVGIERPSRIPFSDKRGSGNDFRAMSSCH